MSGLSTEETEDVDYINKLMTAACLVINKGNEAHNYACPSYVSTLRQCPTDLCTRTPTKYPNGSVI